jgi:hypothetical protein
MLVEVREPGVERTPPSVRVRRFRLSRVPVYGRRDPALDRLAQLRRSLD